MTNEARLRALRLIQEHGWNNTSFQTLEPYFEYWFAPDGTGVIAYYQAWGTWVVAGAPICPLERMLEFALTFAQVARQSGYRVCFFGTASRFAEQISECGTHVKIGEQPCWDPTHWQCDARRMRMIQSQRRRAERKGVTVRQVSPEVMVRLQSEERRQAERVILQWQRAHRMATMSFVVHLDAFSFASERRYFLAERSNASGHKEAVGFLSMVPIYARDGFFLEDLLRTPDAPNGTTEALIDAAMNALACEGKRFATLGLTPLHNIERSSYHQPQWAIRVFRISRRMFDPLYSFQGLAAFKTKLRPEAWEEIYVTGIPKFTVSMLIAVLMAFARSHPTRFAFDTAVRLVTSNLKNVRETTWQNWFFGLAAALVVWISVLSQTNGQFWFGSQATLKCWIAFDCLMVGILTCMGLMVRSRSTMFSILLSFALAAVFSDLCLTTYQASVFILTRPWRWFHLLAWTIAISGPLLASLFLTAKAIAIRCEKRFS